MHKLADLMERDAEALAELEALDNGKSAKVAKEVDLPDSIACIRYYAGRMVFAIDIFRLCTDDGIRLGGQALRTSAYSCVHPSPVLATAHYIAIDNRSRRQHTEIRGDSYRTPGCLRANVS